MCSTSAAKQAAIAIRGGERPAPRNSTRKATTSSATYSARPTIPCSAATVTGIVCEADVAFCDGRSWVALVLGFETSPSRSPAAGVRRTVPGRLRSASCARSSRCSSSRRCPSGRSAGSPAPAARRQRRARRARRADVQRRAHRPSARRRARPGRAAARRCSTARSSSPGPASSHASTAAPTSTSRRRRPTARPSSRAIITSARKRP